MKRVWSISKIVLFFVSIFVSINFLVWYNRTMTLYEQYGLTRENFGIYGDLYFIGKMQYFYLKNDYRKFFGTAGSDALRDFELYLDQDRIDALNANIPYSGFDYQKGKMRFPDGELHPVSIKYRGDNAYHWFLDKKSYRVKTSKKNLYHRTRKFNLIIPKGNDMVNNHLGYVLAHQMGLLAPESKMVNLFVNDNYEGIKLYVEQPGEAFLRKHKRMPGDLFRGENIGVEKLLGTVEFDVFDGTYFWNKHCENNHYPETHDQHLRMMLDEVANSNIDRFSIPDIAKFSAFIHLSQSRHYGATHNWKLYYDPWKERFYPMVWDPLAFWPAWRPLFAISPRMDWIHGSALEAFHRDYRFLYHRHAAIQEFYRSQHGPFLGSMQVEMDRLVEKIKASDYSIDLHLKTLTPEETIAYVEELQANVKRSLKMLKDSNLVLQHGVNKYFVNDTQHIDNKVIKRSALHLSEETGSYYLDESKLPASNFTYDFWFKTEDKHEIDPLQHDAGARGLAYQRFVIFPWHFDTPNTRGTGVSVGVNGVSVYEHIGTYLGARIVYKAKLEGWTHVAVVYKDNAPQLYVNGKLVGSASARGDEVRPPNAFGYHYKANDYFNGLFDEYRFWERPLTEKEIEANMLATQPGTQGLKVHYTFDQFEADTTITDQSGNGYTCLPDYPISNDSTILHQYAPLMDGARVYVDGRIPVSKLIFEYEEPVQGLKDIHISYKVDDQVQIKDITGYAKVAGNQLLLDLPLLSNREVVNNTLHITPGVYDISLGSLALGQFIAVKAEVMDAQNSIVVLGKVPEIAMTSFHNVRNVVVEKPRLAPVRWAGTITINGMQTIEQPVFIAPGTTIKLTPYSTLILKGQVQAVGTYDQPIKFISSSAENPFGAVVLKDPTANGSTFRHCAFYQGSGSKGDTYEYSGMVSVHDVQEVVFEDCSFEENHVVDDMVHVVYSEVQFHRCHFLKAHLDALDADISDILLVNCHFDQVGNDALDLMESVAVVDRCSFKLAGDKGISVGEATELFVLRSDFENNHIGLEAKDDCAAIVANCYFAKNQKGIHAYKKNWRYEKGGTAELFFSYFEDNDTALLQKPLSTIHAYDCYVDVGKVFGDEEEVALEHCDVASAKAATQVDGFEKVRALREAWKAWGDSVDVRFRGKKEWEDGL